MNERLEKIANKLAGPLMGLFGVSQKKAEQFEGAAPTVHGISELLRKAAAEGAVLLKNDGTLPFKEGSCVSLFGRVQYNWFYTGYGSGGEVNRPYSVNLQDGIRNCDKLTLNESLATEYENWCVEHPIEDAVWGMWPRFYPEMPIDIRDVFRASNASDCAVVAIGRSSGEDRDCALEKGSWFLTDDERRLLDNVTDCFDKVAVVLNIGCMADLSWIEEYGDKIGAVLLLWQGGMESGNAAADLLCGNANPCGKLSDTAMKKYEDCPSTANFGNKEFNNYEEDIYVGYRWFETFNKAGVLYPFGYGLSYTEFETSLKKAEATASGFEFTVSIKNTGTMPGKEAVQIYLQKPCAVLGNPARELAAFGKTALLQPGEEQEICLTVDLYSLASYDASGACGSKSAYVIENGEYYFYLGGDVRSAKEIFRYGHEKTTVFEQLRECLAPQQSIQVVTPADGIKGKLPIKRACPEARRNLRERILKELPKATEPQYYAGEKLADVKNGKIPMEHFVSLLSNKELEALTRGDYTMNSKLGAAGNAGAFAGVLPSLRKKGIPPVITTDGPSGIRLSETCSLIPTGTLLACSFDTELVEEVYTAIGAEMKDRGSDVLLAPGMNIHRNPLCGRNFEYYSEDPLLSGKIAAAAVRGIQSRGVSACIKHFACNNQEFARTVNDSRVSERALRQIYLKGFEICIKEAKPQNIMTSYNKINGVYSYFNYDLCTSVLRGEWGYAGNVMTDWWTKKGKSPDFGTIRNQAYRVRAQVDVLMPGGSRAGRRKPDGTLLESLGKDGGITLGELQRSAANVLRFAMNSNAFDKNTTAD